MKAADDWLMEKEIRFPAIGSTRTRPKSSRAAGSLNTTTSGIPDVDDTAMVLLALRKIPTDNPQEARRMFPARLEMDDDLPVQGRRLGGL